MLKVVFFLAVYGIIFADGCTQLKQCTKSDNVQDQEFNKEIFDRSCAGLGDLKRCVEAGISQCDEFDVKVNSLMDVVVVEVMCSEEGREVAFDGDIMKCWEEKAAEIEQGERDCYLTRDQALADLEEKKKQGMDTSNFDLCG